MSDFSIHQEQDGNATVVSISGRVDSATAGTMDTKLEKIIAADRRVVIDFTNVEFLSSAGVRALVKAMKTAKKMGHQVRLAAIPDHIAEVMKTLGMMEIMQVYSSIEEAIGSL